MHPIFAAQDAARTMLSSCCGRTAIISIQENKRMSDLKEDAAKASDAAQVVANEAADLMQDAARARDAAQLVAGEAARVPAFPVIGKATRAIKDHPVALVALIGASAAFIEFELALGMLTGIGATALLATAGGPETRQQLLARSRWLLDRARSKVRGAKSRVEDTVSAAA
jgi:hypothetical protein